MITFKLKRGYDNFKKTIGRVDRITNVIKNMNLDKYGEAGVAALKSATPTATGKTADSWYYKINRGNGLTKIEFYNTNWVDGVPIAIVLQYGHVTRNGGYVEGTDYINPAIKYAFDKMAQDAWQEVVSS